MIGGWRRTETVRATALIRIGVGLLVLFDVLGTWRWSVELYSDAGPAVPMFSFPIESTTDSTGNNDQALENESPSAQITKRSIFAIPSPALAVAAQSLLVFTSCAVVLGWQTRMSLLVTFLLLVWLRPLDLSWTFSKYTVIWLHLLTLLQFSGCGRWLTLDRSGESDDGESRESPVARRLMQLLACQIYLGAAITKLKSSWFVGGELLQYSLLDRGWGGTPLGHVLATSSLAMRGFSQATVLFELLFPFLVWVPRYRRIMLSLAVLFHAAIWATMNVGLFSPTMLVLLLAFVEPETFTRTRAGWFAALAGGMPGFRSRWKSSAIYVVVGFTVAGGGLAIQTRCDWYGVFGNRRLEPLPEVPASVVESMRLARQPAFEEYVHRIVLGTRRGERDVFGDPLRARIGGRLYVLTQFSVPHPELKLEGMLIASDGRLAARFEHKLDSGFSYSIDGFELTADYPPGASRLILQLNGYEIASRVIHIQNSD